MPGKSFTALIKKQLFQQSAVPKGGYVMAINSNCKRCPYYISKKCDGKDANCICRFCPRNL